jgi:hypothetical protein
MKRFYTTFFTMVMCLAGLQAANALSFATTSPSSVGLPSTCTTGLIEETISDCNDLRNITADDTYYKLAGNIDCDSANTTFVAADLNDQALSCVVIDGNNFTVSNLEAIDTTGGSTRLGLFREINNSLVKNINFNNIVLSSSTERVAIFSKAENSSFDDVTISQSTFIGTEKVAALIATNEDDFDINNPINDTKVENITLNNIIIEGDNRLGALVGGTKAGIYENITANNITVMHSSTDAAAAGLIGGYFSVIKPIYLKNAFLDNITVNSGNFNAALVLSAIPADSKISDIYVTGSSLVIVDNPNFSGTPRNFGGLAGETLGNIELDNINIQADLFYQGSKTEVNNVGGLVGITNGITTITNSEFTGFIESFGNDVGGLVGDAQTDLTILNSDVLITLNNLGSDTGGLVGEIDDNTLTIKKSCAYIDANVNGENIGGLVGDVNDDTLIEESFAEGNVLTAGAEAGGLIGDSSSGTDTIVIKNSYAKVNVFADGGAAAGLIGEIDGGDTDIINSYADGSVVDTIDLEEYPLVGEFLNNDDIEDISFTDAYFTDVTAAGITPDLFNNFNTNSNAATVAVLLNSTAKRQQASYQNWDFTNIWYISEGLMTPVLRSKLPNGNFPVDSINLEFQEVQDSQPAGTLISRVVVTDPENDSIACSLVNTSSDISFSNMELKTTVSTDKNTKPQYTITIECNDSGSGITVDKSFVIDVVTAGTGSPNPTIDLSQTPVVQPQAPTPLACVEATNALEDNGFDVNKNSNLENLEKLKLASELNLLINDSQNTTPASTLATNHPKFDLNNDSNVDALDRSLDYASCDIQVHRFLYAAELLDVNLDGKLPKKKLNKAYKKQFKKARKEFLFDRDRNLATVDTNSFYDLFDYNEDDKINKQDKKMLKSLLKDLRNFSIFINATSSSSSRDLEELDIEPADVEAEISPVLLKLD